MFWDNQAMSHADDAKELRDLRLQLRKCREAQKWRPIETAPKDGTRVLGYGRIGWLSEPASGTVVFDELAGYWYCDPNEATIYAPEKCDLTHWMPLPDPPKE